MSNESSICLFCSIAILASTAYAAPSAPASATNFFDAKYPPIAPAAAPIPPPIIAPTTFPTPGTIDPSTAPTVAPAAAVEPIPTFCIVFCPATFVIGFALLIFLILLSIFFLLAFIMFILTSYGFFSKFSPLGPRRASSCPITLIPIDISPACLAAFIAKLFACDISIAPDIIDADSWPPRSFTATLPLPAAFCFDILSVKALPSAVLTNASPYVVFPVAGPSIEKEFFLLRSICSDAVALPLNSDIA